MAIALTQAAEFKGTYCPDTVPIGPNFLPGDLDSKLTDGMALVTSEKGVPRHIVFGDGSILIQDGTFVYAKTQLTGLRHLDEYRFQSDRLAMLGLSNPRETAQGC